MSAVAQQRFPSPRVLPAGTLTRADRIGLIGAWIALIMSAVVAVLALVSALSWQAAPFLGVMSNHTLTIDANRPIGADRWPGLDAGIRRGDHITALNGVFLPAPDWEATRELFQTTLDGLQIGQTVEVTVLRPAVENSSADLGTAPGMTCVPSTDGQSICQVQVTLTRFPTSDFVALFMIPFLCGVVTLLLGITVIVLRPAQPGGRIIALTLAGISIYMTGLFNLNTTYELIPAWILGSQFGAAGLVTIGLTFPTSTRWILRHPIARFLPSGVAAITSGLFLYAHAQPVAYNVSSTIGILAAGVTVVGALILMGLLIYRRRWLATVAQRDQANTVLIGLGVAMIVGVLWLSNTLISALLRTTPVPLNTSAAMPFALIAVISFSYAVLQYRSFDTERVISSLVTYTVMLFGLVLGYFMLVYGTSLFANTVLDARDPILIAVIVGIVAVLFVPLRTRLQARIDRIFFRVRYDYQDRAEQFVRTLGMTPTFERMAAAYCHETEAILQPRSQFMFLPDEQSGSFRAIDAEGASQTDIRFARDSGLIRALDALPTTETVLVLQPGQPWNADLVAERARLNILDARLILALRGSNGALNGFIIVSAPHNELGIYTLEQVRFLQTLTGQVSNAVERTQAVDALERRVRELDVLSQVSQAVNFTVAYDDLLELIATQARKLITAKFLYITLRSETSDELYHALYLEDDERYAEREQQRWPMGRDLFSDVARSGQPLRVANYAVALQERGMADQPENATVRAWMGVPMLVGSRVIGVLSVGTDEHGRTYTDDQLKIFSDIASLAATSLDKARLFDETNTRARQLTALNEISRQLVMAEGDLEGLLYVITNSSVNILRGEAGSLLLMTDDDSGDLEFQIAVGESGGSLKGRRVPAGHGLVGEVATTGEPRIVNDVSRDARWGGEFAQGAFRTNSVLAVPLITPDRVIGVLEVLNKAQGAPFTQEDVDLLITFAGQAAVAIENARLFQLTDQQLGQRVRELETLERIDVELNRSLDLIKVSRITVGWALENISASAAALGVVMAGETPILDIVYQEGYDARTHSEGGREGMQWLLDRGVLGRVMRTRQAELVADVTIDPDYVPLLPGAQSMIVLPMLSGGQINAILLLETTRAGALRIADMPFLQRLTEHASIAITNAQLYAEITLANQSKSKFVSFVAHELKNPLTAIKGNSELLFNGVLGAITDQQKNFLTTIRRSADRMNTIVSDLNDVTKLETNNLEMKFAPTQLADIVTETIRPLERQIADKDQTLILDLPDDLPPIQADADRLIQVMTNLVSNAYKYSPPEGTIRVAAAADSTLRDAKGRQLPPMVHIRVTDTGIGMSAEDVAKLFTAYFRSENPLTREQPGTGLGLTITRGIIERHGGTIWVESILDVGTTFHFTVPLAPEPASIAAQ